MLPTRKTMKDNNNSMFTKNKTLLLFKLKTNFNKSNQSSCIRSTSTHIGSRNVNGIKQQIIDNYHTVVTILDGEHTRSRRGVAVTTDATSTGRSLFPKRRRGCEAARAARTVSSRRPSPRRLAPLPVSSFLSTF